METSIPHQRLLLLSEFVAQKTGLHFASSRWPDLLRGVVAAAAELGMDDSAEYIRRLMSGASTKRQFDAFVSHLTVGETYFFREPRSIEVVVSHFLRSIARSLPASQKRLRIWSAACCTGEEPYSIAIALAQAIPDWRDWNISILATDINPSFLRKAEAGVFGTWSFRNAPAGLQDHFFRAGSDGRYEIVPEIRRLVEFAQLNLVEDTYPSLANNTDAMDFIFCRNVLMYFTPIQAMKAMENLHRAQADDGWLVVSPGETPLIRFPGYLARAFDGTILYQKSSGDNRDLADSHAATSTLESLCGDPLKGIAQPVGVPPTVSAAFRASRFEAATQAERSADPYAHAVSLYSEGNYDAAADLLASLLSNRPNDPAVLSMLAHSLANQGKLTDALRRCDQWIGADRLNPASYYLRSVILREQNSMADAVQSLRKSLYVDPAFVLAHFSLGNIARGCGSTRESDRHMANALRSLRAYQPTDVLPESDGITAGRLVEVIDSLNRQEVSA
jgi:chemotaxis protein methyltransferase CheR